MDCSSLPLLSFIDQNHVTEQLDVMMNFQSDNFFPRQELEVVGNLHHAAGDNLPNPIVSEAKDEVCETKKRKAGDGSRNSSSTSSSLGKNEAYNASSRGKKVKMSGNNEEEKVAKEVVHVRARRGQATDSHSLAERVRRGKINEKLRCLQGIVPGCYKTMGMAVMLDEIINYVQSLQHQVEFLSMKLSTASSYYDFNSDTNCMEMLQRAKAAEAEEVERLMREGQGYGGASKSTTTTIWPY